jgi:hypothetical protein
MTGKRKVSALLLVVLVILGAACSRDAGEEATNRSISQPADATSERSAAKSQEAEAPAGARSGAGSDGRDTVPDLDLAQRTVPDAPVPGGKVIKNISLEIEVEENGFQRRFARAGALAEQFGGFVTSSQVSETDGELASGTLTVRVPSDRFEQAVARLKDLGDVTAEDRSGQDVSKEFVDLEARLRQAKTEEGFFLRMMDEAETISDMIQIQSQLSAVQLRIEEIQGQLNYLNDATSYSTISVRIYEPGAPASGTTKGLAAAWEEAVQGFQSVIGGLVVALGWVTPFGLIALVGLLVFRWRSRPKLPAAEAPAAQG